MIRGLLEGMGLATRCEMLAMKEHPAEADKPLYSRCCVIDAPADLPDGVYQVTFAGHTVEARKEAGLWLPADHADPLETREQRTSQHRSTPPANPADFLATFKKFIA